MKHATHPLADTGGAASAAWQALWDIQAGFLRKAACLQYSLATLGFESGVRQWQLFSAIAERDGLIAGQKEIAATFQPRLAAIARESADALRASSEEFMGWMLGSFTPGVATGPATTARPRPKAAARRTSRKKSA